MSNTTTRHYSLSSVLGHICDVVATSNDGARDVLAKRFGFESYAEAMAAEPELWGDLDAATH